MILPRILLEKTKIYESRMEILKFTENTDFSARFLAIIYIEEFNREESAEHLKDFDN